jgi:hypothetical protein
MHHFLKIAPARSGGAAVRLEPVLGVFIKSLFNHGLQSAFEFIKGICIKFSKYFHIIQFPPMSCNVSRGI